MNENQQKIECPHCNEIISIDEALTHQIEERLKKTLASESRAKEAELQRQKKEIEQERQKLAEARQNAQVEINKKVAEKVASEKVALWKNAQAEADKQKAAELQLLEAQIKERDEKLTKANTEMAEARAERKKLETERENFEAEKEKKLEEGRKKIEDEAFARVSRQVEKDTAKLQRQIDDIEKEKEAEKKLLEEQMAEKDAKLQEAHTMEISLRREKNQLEEERKSFELEKQRQLDEERKKISEDAAKKAAEEHQYIIGQLKKQLTDATKAKDELARKLEQGSQQTQGEVLELSLEELLQTEFPLDDIQPVPKGVKGADITQKVRDRSGRECGQIVWESKRTKAWSEGWIQKLKDDQRAVKAEIAVIVSTALPQDVKGFVFRDGVWICDVQLAGALAAALRTNLESVTRERAMSVGKNEKMEVLYSYLTGVEFRQRVEAIVEAFASMDDGLKKERLAYEKIWAEREKQIKKVITNTVGMYGDLSGLVTLPQIKALELGDGGDK
ncbi:MAG: DUF2130 domain-containing protein [Candidatus Pacebacteria bacterium]|nr:DUF2130 domain-containing protein [Candidatus Paceibacterota bacterium]